MRVTLQPETYSAGPVSVSIPMSQEEEQKLMSVVKPVQTAQEIISIFKTITGEK